MIKCKKCDINIPKVRSEMGYNICVNCSTEQKKVGHIIYPHKTGAYVQVMDRDKYDELNRLDRRGTGVRKLKNYKNVVVKKKNKDSDKTAEVRRYRPSSLDNKLIPYDKVLKMVMECYDEWGYEPTVEYLRELSKNGDIALRQRVKLQELVVERCMKPSPRTLMRRFNER